MPAAMIAPRQHAVTRHCRRATFFAAAAATPLNLPPLALPPRYGAKEHAPPAPCVCYAMPSAMPPAMLLPLPVTPALMPSLLMLLLFSFHCSATPLMLMPSRRRRLPPRRCHAAAGAPRIAFTLSCH